MSFYKNGIMDATKLLNVMNKLYSINCLEEKIKEVTNEYETGKCSSPTHWKSENILLDQLKNYELKGVDIPFWFDPEISSNQLKSKKRIIILGQEPFRTFKSFDFNKLHHVNDIEVSTPFAIHLHNKGKEDNKLKLRLGLYWEIIHALADKNFIYVTDYSKIWFKDFSKLTSKIPKLKEGLKEVNERMWLLELEYIKPDMIICFGNSYTHLLRQKLSISKTPIPEGGYKDKNNITVLPLLHPSGTAAGYREKFFSCNGIIEQKTNVQKYLGIIQRF